MTWLEFIAAMFQSLMSVAWPIAVVASVWIFRNEIRKLLPRFQLKHNGTELSFRFTEAEKAADELPPPPEQALPASPTEISRFQHLAEVSPRSALVEIRREVQDAITAAAQRNGLPNPKQYGARQLLRQLEKTGKLDRSVFSLLDEITSIGNIAAHDSSVDFSTEQALKYKHLADKAIAMLDVPTFLSWAEQSEVVTQK